MNINNDNDTIIAVTTATAGGSVSMLRISGPEAIDKTNILFPEKDLSEAEGGRFFFGRLFYKSKIIDRVVVFIYRTPKSYTGEDIVEISCHANAFIVNKILDVYQEIGCRLAEPGEFSKRAFLNGKMDLAQTEAVASLIAAKSEVAVNNSMFQLEGALSDQIKSLKKDIIGTASLIELDIDFSEEQLEVISTNDIENKIDKISSQINKLIESYTYGKSIHKGIEILITGKPNVGKSSLMNTLLNKERVIVSDKPGTTRDIVHEDIMFNNTMVRFIDSAGIHLTNDYIESEGVERARNYIEQADIVLLIIDASAEMKRDDIDLFKTISLQFRKKIIVGANKIDLGINEKTIEFFNNKAIETVKISATKKTGIDKLKKLITSKISREKYDISEDILITNQRHYNQLKKTVAALAQAKDAVNKGLTNEFIALDLRLAIDHLSEITGEITSDDILNNIFSSFCIGK